MVRRKHICGELPKREEITLIIFTDLDGTLLDHDDYGFDQARPALSRLQSLAIPLIITTSKTRSEVENLQRDLGMHDPFITENGGGVFFPESYRGFVIPGGSFKDAYCFLGLGRPYGEIRDFVRAAGASLHIRGFGDLSPQEVASLTKLSPEEAQRAQCREFTEPVLVEREEDLEILRHLAAGNGLCLTRGDRFYHLIGREQDKGKAVMKATEIFRKNLGRAIRTVGLGNSQNDLSMLASVDVPILIPHPDGHYETVGPVHAIRAPFPGSRGWNAAVMELLDDLT